MGDPDRAKWSSWGWLRQQYNEIKGNAKWDLIKWIVGGPVVVAWFLGLVRWVQHAPWWQVCGLVVVPPTALCSIFAFWLYRKSKAPYPPETPPPEKSALPPQAIYRTLTTEPKAPTLDRQTFEVLKWFSTFQPNVSAPVSYVAQVHGLDSSAALACVKELWHLKFIETVVVAPGEWNGRYAITDKGFNYVSTHAA